MALCVPQRGCWPPLAARAPVRSLQVLDGRRKIRNGVHEMIHATHTHVCLPRCDLAATNSSGLRMSPDGTRFTYMSNETGTFEVVVNWFAELTRRTGKLNAKVSGA